MTKATIAGIVAVTALAIASYTARSARSENRNPGTAAEKKSQAEKKSAQDPQPTPTHTSATKPAINESVPSGGIIAVIDSETHEVRAATAAEIGEAGATAISGSSGNATSAAARSRFAAPTVHRGVGNTVGIVLNGNTDVYSVVTKTPDGKMKMECVTGQKAAAARVTGAQISREVKDEK